MPPGAFNHPLLIAINNAVRDLVGVGICIVHPAKDGWSQYCPGGAVHKPDFCRLIQSTADGAKNCTVCHVLMSIAAAGSGSMDQRCHAGLSVIVMPVQQSEGNEVFSVLSTCMFTTQDRKVAWKEARARGVKLGLDLDELKEEFDRLPVLSETQVKAAKALMTIACEAVKEIRARIRLQEQLSHAGEHTEVKSIAGTSIEQQLKEYGLSMPVHPQKGTKDKKKIPALIRVAEELVCRRPDIAYNVAEIAAAARVTPNYFSALFRDCTGQTFSKFLTDKRIEAAKKLLGDLTLNVSEVAFRVGYDDAGYFTRRFRQSTGMSPREWRDSIAS